MDRLEEARKQAEGSEYIEDIQEATFCVHLAIAHALIAICERLPPSAETWSACSKRLREEEKDGV